MFHIFTVATVHNQKTPADPRINLHTYHPPCFRCEQPFVRFIAVKPCIAHAFRASAETLGPHRNPLPCTHPSRGGVPVQVTKNGGFASAESTDGKYLYFTQAKAPLADLWKMPVEGGEPSEVAKGIVVSNFAVTARGLYYMTQPDPRSDTKLIQFLSFADQKTRVVASIKQGVSKESHRLRSSHDSKREVFFRW
jgi:hypothetical protein